MKRHITNLNLLSFIFIICFVFVGSSSLNGQIIKLKKSVGDGGDPGSTPLDCVVKNSDYIVLSIENNSETDITITNITSTSVPAGIADNVYFLANTVIASNSIYEFTVTLSDNWISLLTSNSFTLNTTIDYYLQYIDDSQNNNDAVMSSTFQLTYKVCSNKPGPGINTHPNNKNKGATINNIIISPNPTKDIFNISYTLEQNTDVNISMFNSTGQKINTLVNEKSQQEGTYHLSSSFSSDETKWHLLYTLSNRR